MSSNSYFVDETDFLSEYEQKILPKVEAKPGEDYEDAGYKLVNILADDFALDLAELDLDGLN